MLVCRALYQHCVLVWVGGLYQCCMLVWVGGDDNDFIGMAANRLD